jgi:putative transcriptional regulator
MLYCYVCYMGKKYNRIKEVLQAKEKTQTWLADKLDVDFVTINRYANNHTQPPIEVFAKIASLLGVKLKDLIND